MKGESNQSTGKEEKKSKEKGGKELVGKERK